MSRRGVQIDDDGTLGPAMQALTPRRRAFVRAAVATPLASHAEWARAAGYSDASDGAKVRAHHVWNDEKVQKAIQEETRRYLNVVGPLVGRAVLEQIARTDGHKDQMRAAEALMAIGGIAAPNEQTLTINHNDNTAAGLMARIREAADFLGTSPSAILGRNDPLLIEGEADDDEG